MINNIKSQMNKMLSFYTTWICRREYNAQSFIRFREGPVEYGFVFRKLAQIYPHTILDVGTFTSALPHLMRDCGFIVTATDNIRDYWPSGTVNRHYHILVDDITNTHLNEKFDFITCIGRLQHIEKADDAVKNMINLLNPNGYLILTFPYNEKNYVHNVYKLQGSSYGQDAPYITQAFSRVELNKWFNTPKCIIKEQEYWQYWDGDYWTVGKQVIPPKQVNANDKHQISCILIQNIF